ncbi:hypothetical protein [Actinokineospora sp. UTMC 2448]|uniref:hypothetical protein n=1 Tax=Actinokineospora sp. UTMC 2448 TaxID=2268449 RepID=UPI00216435A0|nr:hypothetical protein [Actinokineospora sp. UTMC 2448]UVS82452.1 hypothetical protein Actkin_06225 [Actinokineospora sp. UTMC 2448]
MRRLAVLAAFAAAGCSTAVAGQPVPAAGGDEDDDRVLAYFAALNDAGEEGPGSQSDFLRRTQHPDFTDRFCDLDDLVLRMVPVESTLRPDPEWKPEKSAKAPRGEVYVVAVTVTIRRDSTTLGEQIGSQRVVLLDGEAYGFSPCPAE